MRERHLYHCLDGAHWSCQHHAFFDVSEMFLVGHRYITEIQMTVKHEQYQVDVRLPSFLSV